MEGHTKFSMMLYWDVTTACKPWWGFNGPLGSNMMGGKIRRDEPLMAKLHSFSFDTGTRTWRMGPRICSMRKAGSHRVHFSPLGVWSSYLEMKPVELSQVKPMGPLERAHRLEKNRERIDKKRWWKRLTKPKMINIILLFDWDYGPW